MNKVINIEKKVNIIIAIIFILFMVIYYIFLTVLMKNDELYFWYNDNKILFNCLNYIFVIFSLITTERIVFKRIYKKYIDVLNNDLEPEKFIKLTETELQKTKRVLYKICLKINLAAGHSALGKTEEALKILEEIDFKGKKRVRPNLKILYCYNKSLFLCILNRKDEAKEIYKDGLEILEKNKHKITMEMKIYFDILKNLIYHEGNRDEIINLYEEIIKISKEKINIIFAKYNIAQYKEKMGNIKEALELYKEVAEKGNKLYITERSEEKIRELG